MILPVRSLCTKVKLQTYVLMTGEVIKLQGMWWLFEGSEVYGQHWCCNLVTKVDTGNSLILLKTSPYPKICFKLFVHPAITLLNHFIFVPFSNCKKLPQTVQFHLIVYKIFHFNIQLTANIEHKPKTNMQRQAGLPFWILKEGLLFDPQQAESSTLRHCMQSIIKSHQSKGFQREREREKRDWCAILGLVQHSLMLNSARSCLPCQAWTPQMQMHSVSKTDLPEFPSRRSADEYHRIKKTPCYYSDPSSFRSHWLIRKWCVCTNTDYWHPQTSDHAMTTYRVVALWQ